MDDLSIYICVIQIFQIPGYLTCKRSEWGQFWIWTRYTFIYM